MCDMAGIEWFRPLDKNLAKHGNSNIFTDEWVGVWTNTSNPAAFPYS